MIKCDPELTLPSLASPQRSGCKGIEELLRVIADPSDKRVPDVVRACLAALGSQLPVQKARSWILIE